MKTLLIPLLLVCSYAKAASEPIELLCRGENGINVRYSLDLVAKKVTVVRFDSTLDVEVTEQTIASRMPFGGKIIDTWMLDRYTLELSQHDLLGVNGGRPLKSKCEVLKKGI